MERSFFILLLMMLSMDLYSQGSHSDTLYINGKEGDEDYRVVFVDQPGSGYHKKILGLFDTAQYKAGVKRACDTKPKKPGSVLDFAGDWVSVYRHKNMNVAYYPSEPFYNLYISVNDSTVVINDFNDGFVLYTICKARSKKNKLIIEMVDGQGRKADLVFKKAKGQVVEVNSSLFNKHDNRVVRKDAFYQLPIIVNYCPNRRCDEFQFN